ncbi:MAG: hypothetical protein OQL28_00745 [Sedimenticola sp.]|nr:hypothetical protein [Sedimenticola sp.]
MSRQSKLNTPAFISCPFCAMVCDDLSLPAHSEPTRSPEISCEKARSGFSDALRATRKTPLIHGKEATWEQALKQAARMLANASHPLIDGLIGDLLDCKAAARLAENFGGTIDHLHGNAIARNLRIYQQGGWLISSMGEVRNRADLVILVGEELEATHPRLQEKLFESPERLHASAPPAIHQLGHDCLDLLSVVRARLADKPVQSDITGSDELITQLSASVYPVFVIGCLPEQSAELIIRTCIGLVRDINETRRAALLILGSGEGDTTAQLGTTWNNGFGIRTSHARGFPEQDLEMHAGSRLLESGEADLLVWISSLSTSPPPQVRQSTLVFGHPAMVFTHGPPDIFLPVGVPGIQRAGYLHRADGLRMVPLHKLVDSTLPGSITLCEHLISQEPRTC